jgi:hypothetical protein
VRDYENIDCPDLVGRRKRPPAHMLSVVGIMNTGRIFPAAFTFCKAKPAACFWFLFETLKTWFWLDSLEVRVVLADQAAGLISVLPVAMLNCKLQSCTWHVAGNIKKRLAERRYLKDERKEIMNLVWQYIQTENEKDLTVNRAALLTAVKEDERAYIRKNWQPRERRFILAYIRQIPNLGCNASQRVESSHPVTTSLLHHQLSLVDATKRLLKNIQLIFQELQEEESKSDANRPRIVDFQAFSVIRGHILNYAIERLNAEWEACKAVVAATGKFTINSDNATNELEWLLAARGSCDCELLLRFSLPCKHWLISAAQSGVPLQKSLFHPRWWLNGPPITANFKNWQPSYNLDFLTAASRRTNEITSGSSDCKRRADWGLQEPEWMG